LGAIARPDDIRFADNLPKTRSGKILRRLLRAIARNEDITQDLSTLENPAIIDQLRGDEAAPAAKPLAGARAAQRKAAPRNKVARKTVVVKKKATIPKRRPAPVDDIESEYFLGGLRKKARKLAKRATNAAKNNLKGKPAGRTRGLLGKLVKKAGRIVKRPAKVAKAKVAAKKARPAKKKRATARKK
jgi:hypothetical protein